MKTKLKIVVLGLEIVAIIGLVVAIILIQRGDKRAAQLSSAETTDVDDVLVQEAPVAEAVSELVDDLTSLQTVQAAELSPGALSPNEALNVSNPGETALMNPGETALSSGETAVIPNEPPLPQEVTQRYLVDATPFVYCDTDKGLNLREGPSTDSKVITTLHRGAAAAVIGDENEWYHVNYNGIEGYLDKAYVSPAVQSEYRFVVNRTEQMFRIYDNKTGEVLYEIPCITGRHETQYETPTGIFCVYYMQKNAHLRKYNVDVYYWVAINGGIGIHDARWRTEDEFTPDHYCYDGSHGCINITVANMPTIYELVQKGNIVEIIE